MRLRLSPQSNRGINISEFKSQSSFNEAAAFAAEQRYTVIGVKLDYESLQ